MGRVDVCPDCGGCIDEDDVDEDAGDFLCYCDEVDEDNPPKESCLTNPK